jgi:hypothetical protein
MKTFSRRCETGGRGVFGRGGRVLVALASLLAVLGAAASGFSEEKAAAVRKMLEPGASAPGFAVKDTAGESFDFGGERQDPVPRRLLLDLLRAVPAGAGGRAEAPGQAPGRRLARGGRLARRAALGGAVAGFARQEGYTFRVLMDEPDARDAFRVADLFGVSEIPSTFMIEKGGRIAFARKGPVAEEELEKLMQPARKP